MADWAKLIEAIAGLVGAVAWPVAVVLAVWLIMKRYRDAFERLIDRVKSLTYPGGQIDLAELEAANKARVEELEEKVATPDGDEEERRKAARELAEQAQQLGAVQERRIRMRSIRTPSATLEELGMVLAEMLGAERSAKVHRDDDDPPAAVPLRR